MKKHNELSSFIPKILLLIACVFLVGCSGGSSSEPSSVQNDQSTVANPITDEGDLSSLVSTPENDTNNNGIRDIVESSIKDVTQSIEQEEAITLSAKRMQAVIDAHANGGDVETAVYEYEKASYCMLVLNAIRDEETMEGINDGSLLVLVTLASTNNTDNFSDIARPYRSAAPDVDVEECT